MLQRPGRPDRGAHDYRADKPAFKGNWPLTDSPFSPLRRRSASAPGKPGGEIPFSPRGRRPTPYCLWGAVRPILFVVCARIGLSPLQSHRSQAGPQRAALEPDHDEPRPEAELLGRFRAAGHGSGMQTAERPHVSTGRVFPNVGKGPPRNPHQRVNLAKNSQS